MSTVEAIGFDLDGTLIDSAPDIQYALNEGLKRAGLTEANLSDVRRWVGDGPDVLIARALVAQSVRDEEGKVRQQVRSDFERATLDAPLAHGRAYQGIEALLKTLHAQALPLVVVTNKPTNLALAVLKAAGLAPYISRVYGADAPHERKPSPMLLLRAAAWLGIVPARLMMVGDSKADIQSAHAAGCPVTQVSWGYGTVGLAHRAFAAQANSPEQLLQDISKFFKHQQLQDR